MTAFRLISICEGLRRRFPGVIRLYTSGLSGLGLSLVFLLKIYKIWLKNLQKVSKPNSVVNGRCHAVTIGLAAIGLPWTTGGDYSRRAW